VFNDAGANVDFRVEGDTDANLLFVDASTDRVGIGTNTPSYALDITNSASGLRLGSDVAGYRFFRESTGGDAGLLQFYGSQSGFNGYIFDSVDGERMRIDSSGNLLVGTTSSTGGGGSSGKVVVQFNGATTNGIFYDDTRTAAGTSNAAVFVRGTTAVGRLDTTLTDFSLINLSDHRVKTNIQNSDSAISLLDSVQVRQFDWTIDDSHEDFGFVAQELNEVFPKAVYVGKTEEEMWGVNLSKLVPVLTKAIQELKAELDTVKAELATLKG
jgi:hypothetical protein